MTFEEFISKVEQEKEQCQGKFAIYKPLEEYYKVSYYTTLVEAYEWVLNLAKDVEIGEEKHNDFCWDSVNIGDKCVSNGYTGTVSRLIFDSDGYCCGMIVNYLDSDSGDRWDSVYQDNQYNCCEQIGGWMNESGVY